MPPEDLLFHIVYSCYTGAADLMTLIQSDADIMWVCVPSQIFAQLLL